MRGTRRLLTWSACGLLAAGGLLAGAPASSAAAGEACNSTSPAVACIAGFTVSPSVTSAAGGTVTVTITSGTPAGATECYYVNFAVPGAEPPLGLAVRKVAGTTATFRGSLSVQPGVAVGSYPFDMINNCDPNPPPGLWFILGRDIPAGSTAFQPLVVTGTPDHTAPALASLTASSTSVDVTAGTAPLTLRARITDAGVGVRRARVDATFVRDASAPERSGLVLDQHWDLVCSSGTINDGVWSATPQLPAGTKGRWRLTLTTEDSFGNVLTRTPEQLTAAGAPGEITTRTTAVPPKPTQVTGRTSIEPYQYGVMVYSRLAWTVPATGGRPVNAVIDSYSSSCGSGWDANATSAFLSPRGVGFCTVKFRLLNGAGYSPQASVTFW